MLRTIAEIKNAIANPVMPNSEPQIAINTRYNAKWNDTTASTIMVFSFPTNSDSLITEYVHGIIAKLIICAARMESWKFGNNRSMA